MEKERKVIGMLKSCLGFEQVFAEAGAEADPLEVARVMAESHREHLGKDFKSHKEHLEQFCADSLVDSLVAQGKTVDCEIIFYQATQANQFGNIYSMAEAAYKIGANAPDAPVGIKL